MVCKEKEQKTEKWQNSSVDCIMEVVGKYYEWWTNVDWTHINDVIEDSTPNNADFFKVYKKLYISCEPFSMGL